MDFQHVSLAVAIAFGRQVDTVAKRRRRLVEAEAKADQLLDLVAQAGGGQVRGVGPHKGECGRARQRKRAVALFEFFRLWYEVHRDPDLEITLFVGGVACGTACYR